MSTSRKVTISLSMPIVDRLDEIAKSEKQSRLGVMRVAINQFLSGQTKPLALGLKTPKSRDGHGNTPLMVAASCNDGDVQAFINRGDDVNARNEYGQTALMLAAIKGHTETVKALIDAGVYVDTRDVDGWTALMWANDKGNWEIARVLKQHN